MLNLVTYELGAKLEHHLLLAILPKAQDFKIKTILSDVIRAINHSNLIRLVLPAYILRCIPCVGLGPLPACWSNQLLYETSKVCSKLGWSCWLLLNAGTHPKHGLVRTFES